MESQAWSGKTQGGHFGQRALIFYFRYGSLRLAYAVLAVAIPFYMLFDRKALRAMMIYARQRMAKPPRRALFFVYRIYYTFGQTFFDRLSVFARPQRRFTVSVENEDLLQELMKTPQGFLMLSAHVGCFEMLGYFMKKAPKTFYPLLFAGEAEVFQKNRMQRLEDQKIQPLLLAHDGSHIFQIHQALSQGGVVSLLADRSLDNHRMETVDFCGAPAHFPTGIYAIAQSLQLPLLSVFVVREGYRKYRAILDKVECRLNLKPKEQIHDYCQSFASHLQETLQRYPHQWFNFYSFWQVDSQDVKP